MFFFTAIFIFAAFFVSAACGMGGSLILIPALSLVLGVKEGIVLSSLLLGINNIFKLWYYRKDVQLKDSLALLVIMGLGAVAGAFLMVQMEQKILAILLFINIGISFLVQRTSNMDVQKGTGLGYALLSGFCSGLSGTSGPLKGLAVRCYFREKASVVATASLLSFATDMLKSGVYFSQQNWLINPYLLLLGIAMMPLATYWGQKFNRAMSTRAYDALFYTVMSGYVVRLFI